jgi:hypothetical protein
MYLPKSAGEIHGAQCVAAPKGTQPEIIDRLNKEINQAPTGRIPVEIGGIDDAYSPHCTFS